MEEREPKTLLMPAVKKIEPKALKQLSGISEGF